jgi:hypothetical protein
MGRNDDLWVPVVWAWTTDISVARFTMFFFWKLYRATGRAACEPVPARPTVSLFLLALCVHVRVLAASLSESERATTVQPRVELGPT